MSYKLENKNQASKHGNEFVNIPPAGRFTYLTNNCPPTSA